MTDRDPSGPSLVPESMAPETSRLDAFIGRTIDNRYLVESVLGEGGIGVVYKARHTVIGKAVAIKVLRQDVARDDAMTQRFLLEAQAVSGIGSPHIIDVSDFGMLPDGSRYFVMEYLPGQSLADLIEKQHPLPVTRILTIAKQIAAGLGAAHDAGIVHRDMKPDNVIVLERPSATAGAPPVDFVKIFDFGIALVGGRSARLTVTGAIFGSPRYMSPEQATGIDVDGRADIYALGVILYEMVCGKVPFDAENVMIILGQHMNRAPTPLLARVPPAKIPPELDAIVLKCLAKDASDRYSSMKELVFELEKVERLLQDEPTSASAPESAEEIDEPAALLRVKTPAPRTRMDSDIPIPLTRAPRSTPTLPATADSEPPPPPSPKAREEAAAVRAGLAQAGLAQAAPLPAEAKRPSGWIWGPLVLLLFIAGGVLVATRGGATVGRSEAIPSAMVARVETAPSSIGGSVTAPSSAPWQPTAPAPTSEPSDSARPASSSPPKPTARAATPPSPPVATTRAVPRLSATVFPSTPGPAASATTKPTLDCDPPYTFDAQHHKHYKRECPL